MNPSFRRLLVCAISATVLLSACSGHKGGPSTAATVNGAMITNSDVQTSIPLYAFLAAINKASCGSKEECARQALTSLITDQIIQQYAAPHDLSVSDADLSAAVSQIEKSTGGASGFNQILAKNHLSQAQFDVLWRRVLLLQKVQAALGAGKISDAELQKQYQSQKKNFTTLHVQHILVKTKAEADKILAQATPDNFAALAAKYSTDTGSAQNGGDINSPASQLVAPFADAVMAAKPGQIIGPVHTQFGYHIIHVISVDTMPFDQAKTQLLAKQAGPIFSAWLAKQTGAAKITVNPRYGTFDTKTGQVVPVNSTSGSPSGLSPSSPPPNLPVSPSP